MQSLRKEFEQQKSYHKEDFEPFCNGYKAGVAVTIKQQNDTGLVSPSLIRLNQLVEDALNAAHNDGATMMSDLPSPGSIKQRRTEAQEAKEGLLLAIRKLIENNQGSL